MDTFVFKDVETSKFIAIDDSAGGCPYLTDYLWCAKIWSSIRMAKEYVETMKKEKDWELHKIFVDNHAMILD